MKRWQMTRRIVGINRERWSVALQFKALDMWVGAFWQPALGPGDITRLWVCLLPMLPIHICWRRARSSSSGEGEK